MHANPSTLDTTTLVSCLVASAGEERDRQVDFLLYLAEFDAREAFREKACDSLWEFCRRELRLRSGAAGRRIGAMRVLRDFPSLEAPLRDGRLCLTTVVTLRPVLTRENLDEMVARAACLSDEETAQLVASLRPRPAPREGLRTLAMPMPARTVEAERPVLQEEVRAAAPVQRPEAPRPERRATFEPVSADLVSLRADVTPEFKADLRKLQELRSHVHRGKIGPVLHEAVRIALEHFGKQAGTVKPERKVAQKPAKAAPPGERVSIPRWMKRAVRERDGNRCTYVSPDGKRCESRWQLEFDHEDCVADGGETTVEKLRLRCKPHNIHRAEARFGREYMLRCRKRQPDPAVTLAGESDSE